MTEIWKTAYGHPLYEASNLGRFRWKFLCRLIGVHIQKHNGYGYVRLKTENGFKNFRAHKIVLESFVEQSAEGSETRHLNGNRSDNRLCNLGWGTKQENYADKVRHGTVYSYYTAPRDEHPNAKLMTEDVAAALYLIEKGWLQDEVARLYGVHQSTISLATRRAEMNLSR